MAFLERIRGIGRPTLTEEGIGSILAGIAPAYGIKLVAFSAESAGGTVRRSDGLEIYVVNDGSMDGDDMERFADEVERALRRRASFFAIPSDATRDDFEDIRVTVAFPRRGGRTVGSPCVTTTDCRRGDSDPITGVDPSDPSTDRRIRPRDRGHSMIGTDAVRGVRRGPVFRCRRPHPRCGRPDAPSRG